jgi:hypothetical protein
MKDLIRMNQLAGVITESQARKMMQILNEDNTDDLLGMNRPKFKIGDIDTHLLKKLQDYITYYDMSENGYGEVNGMHATDYADIEKEKIQSQITSLKGKDYFDNLYYFANLNTFYGDEDKMEELAGKLGYTVDELKDL